MTFERVEDERVDCMVTRDASHGHAPSIDRLASE
jgi:hypothetical protein